MFFPTFKSYQDVKLTNSLEVVVEEINDDNEMILYLRELDYLV